MWRSTKRRCTELTAWALPLMALSCLSACNEPNQHRLDLDTLTAHIELPPRTIISHQVLNAEDPSSRATIYKLELEGGGTLTLSTDPDELRAGAQRMRFASGVSLAFDLDESQLKGLLSAYDGAKLAVRCEAAQGQDARWCLKPLTTLTLIATKTSPR